MATIRSWIFVRMSEELKTITPPSKTWKHQKTKPKSTKEQPPSTFKLQTSNLKQVEKVFGGRFDTTELSTPSIFKDSSETTSPLACNCFARVQVDGKVWKSGFLMVSLPNYIGFLRPFLGKCHQFSTQHVSFFTSAWKKCIYISQPASLFKAYSSYDFVFLKHLSMASAS